MVEYMLWSRHGLAALRLIRTLDLIYDNYLESTGEKANSKKEARSVLSNYRNRRLRFALKHRDLLTPEEGQRQPRILLKAARVLWPRRLMKK
jgi:hypothetical protein